MIIKPKKYTSLCPDNCIVCRAIRKGTIQGERVQKLPTAAVRRPRKSLVQRWRAWWRGRGSQWGS
jgi:hypothetical protein